MAWWAHQRVSKGQEQSLFSPKISALIGALKNLRVRDSQGLAQALGTDLGIDDVAPWIHFDTLNYRRNLIHKGEGFELRLLCWRPGQTSSLHGHNRAACAFRILRGQASEIVLGERDRVWPPGHVIIEDTPELVHQVGNLESDSLVSLHAYAPALPVDHPSTAKGRAIAIVGGGFSGVALALHLLRCGGPDLRIALIESGPWLGRGIAYGVESPLFRLNVPASRMSIDSDLPDDFVQFAESQENPHAFLSRTLYGDYVEQRFGEALRASPAKLRVIRGQATQIDSQSVFLSDGRSIAADAVVLATGLQPRLQLSWLAEDFRIVDAWDECALADIDSKADVLVLGSGLTALDVISTLHLHRHQGHISVLSRHGLLPGPHLHPFAAAQSFSPEQGGDIPARLVDLVRWLRDAVAVAQKRGEPWQHVIDAFRPHVPRLWQGLSIRERQSFVRHLRPYWEVLRHRAPVDALSLVEEWKKLGKLDLRRGRVLQCRPQPSGLLVTMRSPDGEVSERRFGAIVRCIGPALQFSQSNNPLLSSLLNQDLAVLDATGLGISVDGDGRLFNSAGIASSRLFALGALRRASFWETTSVPDIAVQAKALARALV